MHQATRGNTSEDTFSTELIELTLTQTPQIARSVKTNDDDMTKRGVATKMPECTIHKCEESGDAGVSTTSYSPRTQGTKKSVPM